MGYSSGDFICNAKIWDSSGQPHLRDTVRTQYRQANAIMFVFDVTRRETLDDVTTYVEAAKLQQSGRKQELILVGNKIDVAAEREVSREDGYAFVLKHGMNDYREVSAKSGANVQISFRNALTHIAYYADSSEETQSLLGNRSQNRTRGNCGGCKT